MQNTEVVVTATLCLERGTHISTKNSYPGSAGMLVLACAQYRVILTFFQEDKLCSGN